MNKNDKLMFRCKCGETKQGTYDQLIAEGWVRWSTRTMECPKCKIGRMLKIMDDFRKGKNRGIQRHKHN
jgi:hypothetical protein